ncbi:MAG TPA: hypothetical protein VF595_02740 [Tepidisphaeraceae bacterium]|jgi:hypothetical protein
MPDSPHPDDLPKNPSPDDLPEKPPVYTRDVIDEALRLQAERRKPSGPPKEMPVTPTLPRQPRPARDRKRRRRGN